MTICANCGQPTSDVYHVDGRTIGGCCWDPFGTLWPPESPSQTRVEG